MSGCFDNSPYDRSMEIQLDNYLKQQETFYCPYCNHECNIDDCVYYEDSNVVVCPSCNKRIKI